MKNIKRERIKIKMRANRFAQSFSFCVMSSVKILSWLFFRFEINWLSDKQTEELKQVKLIVVLNHTSLWEAMLVRLAPFSFLWRIARHMMVPIADITANRPVVGRFFHALLPGFVPISRKRDDSWEEFLKRVNDDAIIGILPEGRMRRHDGKDKHGKPMTVRGGVADILDELEDGNILFVYSGGLHHIQVPGQTLPKLFKKVKVNMEIVSIKEYKDNLSESTETARKMSYVNDIQRRLEQLTPFCEKQPYNQ
jgi:1-acyl-sn-glycerol-3-phosphate acyltransferase